jgi:hypothetical protein
MSSRKLACNVLEHTAGKFKSDLTKFIISSLTEDVNSSNDHIDRVISLLQRFLKKWCHL